MFPIRDTTPRRSTPYVVYAIIAINCAVFLYEISLGLIAGGRTPQIAELFYTFGMVPAFYTDPAFALEAFGSPPSLLQKALPFVTSVFLHGGIFHILGNMWMLYIFGDNVEDWFGRFGFAVFYIGCGIAAGLAHFAFNTSSPMPTIGASGAIAGVMGAYTVLYPRARVMTLVPIFIFIQFIELPAWVFLGIWFLMQLLSSTAGAAASVAWFAHIGGFIVGALVVLLLGGGKGLFGPRSPRKPPPTQNLSNRVDDYWK